MEAAGTLGQAVGQLVAIFAAAVLVVVVLRRLKVPSIAGLIVAGMIIGPQILGIVPDVHRVEALAEVGVVLLLFGIGLELSLDRLRRMWQPILIGGALQMAGTVGATVAGATLFGLPLPSAIFLGFLIAVSSTAIVLRGLETRGELEAAHGRLTLGILVFQDLSVIPMMLAIPILAGEGGSLTDIVLALGKAAAVLVGVVALGRFVVRRLLDLVAGTRERDLFVLTVSVICLGIAWIGAQAGISLALGAFLAGIVVAGTRYRHQALSELIPFREVLTSLFFISVGMLLDPRALVEAPLPILGLTAGILIGKFLIIFAVGLAMRLPLRVSVLSGVALAQVGEFSFVMAHAAEGRGLLDPTFMSQLSVAVTLSMLVTPILLMAGPHLAAGVVRLTVLERLLGVRTPEDLKGASAAQLRDHVVIAGYGLTGQELARELTEHGVPHVIVDLNPENVRAAEAHGYRAYFGDVTSPEVLRSMGLERARELVVCINDSAAVARAVEAARRVAPDVKILVRTAYARDVETLLAAGADEVIPAEVQVAVEVAATVLRRAGMERDRLAERVDGIRGRLRDQFPAHR